jgi:hypothetical protein
MKKYEVSFTWTQFKDGYFQEDIDAESEREAIEIAVAQVKRDELLDDIEIDGEDAEEIEDYDDN